MILIEADEVIDFDLLTEKEFNELQEQKRIISELILSEIEEYNHY